MFIPGENSIYFLFCLTEYQNNKKKNNTKEAVPDHHTIGFPSKKNLTLSSAHSPILSPTSNIGHCIGKDEMESSLSGLGISALFTVYIPTFKCQKLCRNFDLKLALLPGGTKRIYIKKK